MKRCRQKNLPRQTAIILHLQLRQRFQTGRWIFVLTNYSSADSPTSVLRRPFKFVEGHDINFAFEAELKSFRSFVTKMTLYFTCKKTLRREQSEFSKRESNVLVVMRLIVPYCLARRVVTRSRRRVQQTWKNLCIHQVHAEYNCWQIFILRTRTELSVQWNTLS